MFIWWAIIRAIVGLWAHRRERWSQAIVFAIVVTAVGTYLVFNVTFMEEYFPKANAAVHAGDIMSESDVEYRTAQIFKDIAALDREFKPGTDWTGFRTEAMSRIGYLSDLKEHNEILQKRIVFELSQNLGSQDACEAAALNELGPAIDGYVTFEADQYSVIQNTPVATADTFRLLDKLGEKGATLGNGLKTVFANFDKKGCNK